MLLREREGRTIHNGDYDSEEMRRFPTLTLDTEFAVLVHSKELFSNLRHHFLSNLIQSRVQRIVHTDTTLADVDFDSTTTEKEKRENYLSPFTHT